MGDRVKKWIDGPWRVDNMGLGIWCDHKEKGANKLLDIRGWGFLTGKGHGALGLDSEEAESIQIAIGNVAAAAPAMVEALEMVVKANNEDLSGGFLEHDEAVIIDRALAMAYGETQ